MRDHSRNYDLNILSEVAPIRIVLVHTPGEEMSLVSPSNRLELLFDDILFTDRAQAEHRQMCDVFRKVVGRDDSVVQLADLLEETFRLADARAHFVEMLSRVLPEQNFQAISTELLRLDPEDLYRFALTGLSPLPVHALPAPNLMFTRDLCAVVGKYVILSHAATAARSRESVIMNTILSYHPRFQPSSSHLINLPPAATFEGGDLLVASDEVVLVGHSERTSMSGVMAITQALFEHTRVEHVVMVDIPKHRSSMHLDTVLTFCTHDECVYFPPVIDGDLHNTIHFTRSGQDNRISSRVYANLPMILDELLDVRITYIPCGGNDPLTQQREQWTDGANLFALSPGLVAGYERNNYTFQALRDYGYRIVSGEAFLSYYEESEYKPGEKVAVKLEGNELSRGRGGPRCMTMPLARLAD